MYKSLKISKNNLERILKPVNKMAESCVLKTDSSGIFTICSSADNTVILYARMKVDNIDTQERINVINIKRLLTGLQCLDDDNFSLEKCENNIKCSSESSDGDKTHFKYHLVDDSVIRESVFNIKKIASLDFDSEFVIPANKIRQIMSGYAFTSDTQKIYFYSNEQKEVFADINDATNQNIDNITFKVSADLKGNHIKDATPINIEIFKNLAGCRNDIKVKINNQFKVFVFQNNDDDNVELKYIVSALVK